MQKIDFMTSTILSFVVVIVIRFGSVFNIPKHVVSCHSHRSFSTLQRVPVPVMGESITQGVLASWQVKVGDSVNADDVVGSIETDKVNGEHIYVNDL